MTLTTNLKGMIAPDAINPRPVVQIKNGRDLGSKSAFVTSGVPVFLGNLWVSPIAYAAISTSSAFSYVLVSISGKIGSLSETRHI